MHCAGKKWEPEAENWYEQNRRQQPGWWGEKCLCWLGFQAQNCYREIKFFRLFNLSWEIVRSNTCGSKQTFTFCGQEISFVALDRPKSCRASQSFRQVWSRHYSLLHFHWLNWNEILVLEFSDHKTFCQRIENTISEKACDNFIIIDISIYIKINF